MTAKINNLPTQINTSSTDVVRIVQVTDSHIFADPEGCLLGLNTRESFEAVCKRVELEEWKADFLLTTGDLAQDASKEAYEYLANYFEKMDFPTFWLAGNHDSPEVMKKTLTNSKVSPSNHIITEHWQVILLDSSEPGAVHGLLSEEELLFLESCLSQYPDKHSLVVLHHHPVDVDCDWLKNIGLKNKDAFLKIINKNENVKGVLWGHIHQEYEQEHNGIPFIATPSSCVQFTPGSQDFSADTKAPGYRYLSLFADGRIESVVHRIDNVEFTVDYSIKGY
ncbi:MAG: 3',5'-cyclic-AMP phosphodiesterase [Kangiellaceae bacterium]